MNYKQYSPSLSAYGCFYGGQAGNAFVPSGYVGKRICLPCLKRGAGIKKYKGKDCPFLLLCSFVKGSFFIFKDRRRIH